MKKVCASIELTNVCNFRCVICPHAKRISHTRPRGYISSELFSRAVSECAKSAKSVTLGFFGEETLHPEYIDFVKYLRNKPFKVIINTNLSVCTKETMSAWISAGVDQVRFSVDAVTPSVFNVCRPGTVRDFNGKLANNKTRMSVINEKIKYWFSLPKHRPTRLVFIKSSYNNKDKKNFINHWRKYLKRQDHILCKQVLSYAGKIRNPYVIPHRCNVWEIRYAVIGWDGTVSPCNLDINLALKLGNIKNNTLSALYTNPAANKLREQTGCGRKIEPCVLCVDGNNWTKNETIYWRKV